MKTNLELQIEALNKVKQEYYTAVENKEPLNKILEIKQRLDTMQDITNIDLMDAFEDFMKTKVG